METLGRSLSGWVECTPNTPKLALLQISSVGVTSSIEAATETW